MLFLQHPVGSKLFDADFGVGRLATKWCAEPFVHGSKARPRTAVYVE